MAVILIILFGAAVICIVRSLKQAPMGEVKLDEM